MADTIKEQGSKTAIALARAELKTMGWKNPLTYGRQTISTLDLREFLSTVWLTTNNVDIMMEDLASRTRWLVPQRGNTRRKRRNCGISRERGE